LLASVRQLCYCLCCRIRLIEYDIKRCVMVKKKRKRKERPKERLTMRLEPWTIEVLKTIVEHGEHLRFESEFYKTRPTSLRELLECLLDTFIGWVLKHEYLYCPIAAGKTDHRENCELFIKYIRAIRNVQGYELYRAQGDDLPEFAKGKILNIFGPEDKRPANPENAFIAAKLYDEINAKIAAILEGPRSEARERKLTAALNKLVEDRSDAS
jgi:hypothetical protein